MEFLCNQDKWAARQSRSTDDSGDLQNKCRQLRICDGTYMQNVLYGLTANGKELSPSSGNALLYLELACHHVYYLIVVNGVICRPSCNTTLLKTKEVVRSAALLTTSAQDANCRATRNSLRSANLANNPDGEKSTERRLFCRDQYWMLTPTVQPRTSGPKRKPAASRARSACGRSVETGSSSPAPISATDEKPSVARLGPKNPA